MKKQLLTLVFGLTTVGAFSQTVYQEDFNDSDGGWTVTAGTLWEWGTPAGDDINYDGSECGGDAWATNLDGDYTNSADELTVESPIMDCSGLTEDPLIAFDLYYITESCCDEGWVEFSIDGGESWTKLLDGGEAIGWYNDTFNDWWDGTNDGWTTVSNVIPGAAGAAEVQVRFVFDSDGSVVREGFAFDNVFVGTEYQSVTMLGVSNVASGAVIEDPVNIEVTMNNNTGETILGIDVCYSIDGGDPVCETILGIPAGESTYTFPGTEDFSAEGTYELVAYISALDSDPNNCDDTATVVAVLINPITEYPYTETFESPSAFITEGTWEVGEPAEGSLFFNRLACSPDSMVLGTNIGGDYPNSAFDFVYTPVFDFSTLTEDPYVLFDLFRETESCCDEAWMEYTIDAGESWIKVGTAGTGYNWYNDTNGGMETQMTGFMLTTS